MGFGLGLAGGGGGGHNSILILILILIAIVVPDYVILVHGYTYCIWRGKKNGRRRNQSRFHIEETLKIGN